MGTFGAWTRTVVRDSPQRTGRYTGAQAARWADLQEQAETKRAARKARRRGGRR
jgi:hypothetical protein